MSEAVALARAGDWTAFESLYIGRAPSDRYHFLRGVAEIGKLEGPTPAITSETSAVVAAGLKLGWAWRYRGGGLGVNVSDRAAANMVRLLAEAAEILDAQERLDSVGRALRIRIEMGLGGSRGILQHQLNAASLLEETNLFVPVSHLMFVAPKWHGSIAEILEVAREYERASSHPAWKALPAMAHAEAHLYRVYMSNSIDEKIEAQRYYRSAEFAEEIVAIDDAFWRSREATFTPIAHAELNFAHNQLAYLFYVLGDQNRLVRHVERIGRDLTAIPWGYAGIAIEHGGALRAVESQARSA